jgi:organic radical activating enzyme
MTHKIKGKISEVFHSVQGEGIYFGERQLFVRLFGCNLSCIFCDTRLDRFTEYEPHELLEEIALYDDFHSISFTGGEPLLQVDFLEEVLSLTKKKGHKNYLETNGTLAGELERVIDYVDIISMDVKLPSSTGMGALWGMHRKFLKVASKKEVFIKTIICGSTKEEELREALLVIRNTNPGVLLILQPNSYEKSKELVEKLETFQNICFSEGITACIIPQMQKVVGIR